MNFTLRVAIADDDPGMRESLQQMLCDLGHEVVAVADNGPTLIELCATVEPDVVITGTLTPEMYGCDAAEIVYRRRPIPILLYSSHCEPDRVRNAEHKHVFMYLVKPLCEEHLQAALRECDESRYPKSNESPRVDPHPPPLDPAAVSVGNAPYREPSRPPYRQLPR